MSFQRVLLITPPVKTELGPVRPSLGLGYLAQVLFENGIEYDVMDMLLGYTLDDLRKRIARFNPDLLGVSLFSNKYKTAYRTIECIKNEFPSLKVVVGGPHVSCLREKVLEDCLSIDYGIILEGEYALLELCRGEKVDKIKNLMYRDGRKVIASGTREFISDLDAVPFPKYAGFEMGKYIAERSIISSRGCAYSCIYCAVKMTSGMKIRLRSPKNVVEEMSYWHGKGCRQFSFQDDNFTVSKERVLEICEEIEKEQIKGLFLRCAGARADRLDHQVLKRMKDVGFKTIAIGVEVGNDRMLEVIKKGEKFEDIDRAVKNACDLGFDVYLNFLAGVPHETLSDIDDSVNFARKYPVFYAEWSNIIPYPGTELYDWLEKKSYLLKQAEEYLNDNSTVSRIPVFETPELSYAVRRKVLTMMKKVGKKIFKKGVTRKLASKNIPWGLRHFIGHVISSDIFMKYLFQNKIRRIADSIRFRMYMKRRASR